MKAKAEDQKRSRALQAWLTDDEYALIDKARLIQHGIDLDVSYSTFARILILRACREIVDK